jgi:hypothetical protein
MIEHSKECLASIGMLVSSRFSSGIVLGIALASGTAQAASVVVPYSGSYDESVVPGPQDGLPAGDYDTLGGLEDVGLFNLIDGSNTFAGSVYTPTDSADVFLISVGANQTLDGASISFGTNLSPFNPLFAAPGPQWTLEESDTDPTIFNITNIGDDGMTGAKTSIAPAFSRGEGVYSVLIGNGTFAPNNGGPVDYTMTFTVTSTVPVPAAAWLFGSALIGLAGIKRKK